MNIMNAMMLSCVKATELMEMKEHVPLGLLKTMQLHIHTAMCSGCRNYMKQTKLIDELLRRTFETAPVVADTNELEAAIISKLQ
jgi:predicted anti-sigma-YlaC factor YlaD